MEFSDSDKKNLLEEFRVSGLTPSKFSEIKGIRPSTFQCWYEKSDFYQSHNNKIKAKILSIIKMYLLNHTVEQISKKLTCSRDTIRKVLREKGIWKKPTKKAVDTNQQDLQLHILKEMCRLRIPVSVAARRFNFPKEKLKQLVNQAKRTYIPIAMVKVGSPLWDLIQHRRKLKLEHEAKQQGVAKCRREQRKCCGSGK